MKRKICVFTGTRAEYGLLKPLMDEIADDVALELQLMVSGMHLSTEFGLTYRDIEDDGFTINKKIDILLGSDSGVGVAKSTGLGMIGFAESFSELKPDIVIILGDRFESFAATAAAHIINIPIAHIHGGEITQGAFDDAFRHSITKMSHLHFTSTEEYRKRVIQLGESPDRVFNVGALGIENIRRMKLLSKKDLEKEIEFALGNRCLLVTFHPETLAQMSAQEQFQNLLGAIKAFDKLHIIFTKANADTGGRVINQMIDLYVNERTDKTIAFSSMGQRRYLSTIKHVEAVIGNSSSGIIEAPSLNIPTVNIGDRQKGRVRAKSVVDCAPTKDAIINAIKKVLSPEFKQLIQKIENPYEKNSTAKNIKEIIKHFDLRDILKKEFYDISLLDKPIS